MKIKVNETPVRTSRNFRINNLKLDDVTIPENSKEFENIKVEVFNKNGNSIFEGDNTFVVKDHENVKSKIDRNISKSPLTYGNGKILETNVFENANNKIKIETGNEDIFINYNFDNKNLEYCNNQFTK